MTHEMICVNRAGTQAEFTCEACDRRLIIDFSDCARTVLERGDESARHFGTMGNVRISADISTS